MAVTGFVVELYLPKHGHEGLAELAGRARAAADELTREGAPVRYRGAVLLPDEDTCFCLYEAASAAVVVEASRRASIRVDRIVRALTEAP